MTKTLEITCSGYGIVADWYDGVNADDILLVLPGYTSTRARQKEYTEALVAATGMSALVIDYSGHGDSPFELAETRPAQHLLEVVHTFDWLRTAYPSAGIFVSGSSYGSFLAAQLSMFRRFDKLVLRAPAIYKPQTFYDPWAIRPEDQEDYNLKMDSYRRDMAQLEQHPMLERGDQFAGHTLVVVHEHDEVVPQETTDAYIEAFMADSFVAEGFTHSIGQSPITPQQLGGYYERIADWLRTPL
jgi:esterase/lipase